MSVYNVEIATLEHICWNLGNIKHWERRKYKKPTSIDWESFKKRAYVACSMTFKRHGRILRVVDKDKYNSILTIRCIS